MRLYIDPGTGSMLFSLAVGLVSVIWFGARKLYMKVKYLTPGKKNTGDNTIPLVIYSDDKRYWQVFDPVVRELDARAFPITYLTQSPDDPALSASYPHLKAEFIGQGNKGFAKLNFLNAAMLLSTTPGLDVYQWKRSKDVKYYIHMLHGPNEVVGYKMFGVDFYDGLMLSGEYQKRDIRNLEKLRGEAPKDIEFIGVPYLDEMVKRLEAAGAIPEHPRTVLLAPTWGASSIFNKFGGRVIDELLKTGYHIIVRPHPQSFTADKELMEKLMSEYPESNQLEWSREPDNFEVLRRSDVMISDYSGVIFDFALVFDKPVICTDTELNIGPFDVWWLNTPYWTTTALPRIGPTLTADKLANIKAVIDQAIDDKSYVDSRHEVRNETWMYRGEGAKRAANFIMKKYKELTQKQAKPEQKEAS
jgi:hypothetical protein